MTKDLLKYFGLLILLIALQLFLFNNIQLSGYINPYVYILFILLLPLEIPGWLLLLLGFLTGLSVDTFMNTHGTHSSATLFMAFLRPYVLNFITQRDDIEKKGSPTMKNNGFNWFFRYALILVLAHHLTLFLIENFSLVNFGITLWRAILSTVVTLVFVLTAQLLAMRR
jgi:hypothetical protein